VNESRCNVGNEIVGCRVGVVVFVLVLVAIIQDPSSDVYDTVPFQGTQIWGRGRVERTKCSVCAFQVGGKGGFKGIF
jgi:hypothetical protein